MRNPWIELGQEPPFLLGTDYDSIMRFNESADEIHRIHHEVLPEPFLGDQNAGVVLLSLNPGFNLADEKFHIRCEYFKASLRKNLVGDKQDYPFYLLDPKNSKTPGYKWWNRKLKRLIDASSREKVAQGMLCIEFFPYHSKKYRSLGRILASQEYNFYLLREALRRNATVVVMRSRQRWLKHVPELASYNYLCLLNPQNPSISQGNLPDGFRQIVEKLK